MDKNNQNQTESGMEELVTFKDDALFQSLNKSKKKKRRRIIRTITVIVLVIAIVLVAGVIILQRRVREEFASTAADVQSYEVTTGTISTVVSGSGTLQNVDTEAVTVPAGVDVTELLVAFGDTVQEGDLIAAVDMGTVRSTMSELQTAIEDLDEQISEAEDDTVSTYIKAGVAGRVKLLYAQEDQEVTDVMVDSGALAVLSLDGYMALDIETQALSSGDSVTVKRQDGDTLEGIVESAAAGKATILVTDNGPVYGETVTVMAEGETQIGEGTLYIHNPLSVTGYAGKVSSVNVSENAKVYASTKLFTLTDTATSANYDALLRQRQEQEEILLELLQIQRKGGVTSPIDGSVYSLGDAEEEGLTEVAVLSPDISMSVTITVDEADILSLEVGQEADVTVSSVSEDTLTGTVTQIDKTASTGSYTAVVTLDKQTGMLQGMTASVDVRIEGVEDAVIIPVDALHQTSTGAYVYTSYDEETQEYGGRVDVVTGLSNSSFVQIESGLSAGDTVFYTEAQSFGNMFGAMPGNMGGSQQMPGDGQMPDFGGQMPDMGGGQRGSSGSQPQMPGNAG